MSSKLYLYIVMLDYSLSNFILYDENQKTVFLGADLIKDRREYCLDLKTFCKLFYIDMKERYLIKISEQEFNYFLELDFQDLKQKKDIFNFIGKEEYAI